MPINVKISMFNPEPSLDTDQSRDLEGMIGRTWRGGCNCFGSLNSVSKMQINSRLCAVEFVLDFGSCSGFYNPMLMFPRLYF